ncbi:hypothetical protein FI667_g8808, partial [Globisporangium splendens]
MGSRPIPVNAVPRPALSRDEEYEFKALADESVRETLLAYEDFVYVHNRCVDKARWKLVKEKEDVHVYRERGNGAAAVASSSTSASSSSSPSSSQERARRKTLEIGPKAAMAANSAIPLFLVHGTVQGTIDDALYGSYADDTTSMRRRSIYMQDLMESQTILSTLEGPTMEDPFNHLSLVWMLRDFPGLGAVVKHRDFLILSKTGTTATSRGERIGYCLMHSVTHPDLPQFDAASVVRAKTSFCLLFRQIEADRLDVFNQVATHVGGNMMSFLVLQEVAATLLTCGKAINCANKKKLFYFMRKQARALSASTIGGMRGPPSSPDSNSSHSSTNTTASTKALMARFQNTDKQISDSCASCSKSFSRLFSASSTWCQLCQQMICSRCVVKKKIVVEASEKKAITKPFEFCIVCMFMVKNASARQIHIDELQQRHTHFT